VFYGNVYLPNAVASHMLKQVVLCGTVLLTI